MATAVKTLHVFLNDRKIGVLSQENGQQSFQYAAAYLNDENAYPLSVSLPLTIDTYYDPAVENYFSNLLPDERIRATIAFILHVPKENTFALLKGIGADCAGAVALYEPGQTPQSQNDPVYRELSEDEAYAVLDNLGQRPLDVGDDGIRISGAGSQEKLVACVFGNRVVLPLYGTPSTHIVKPPILSFPDSVFNEYFCMKLAKACGILTPECSLLRLKGELFYVVERFDRQEIDGHPHRLHQEDFCQLLNISPQCKYQDDGGPGVEECVRQMAEMRLPANSRIQFIRLLIFNFLIGNCDAHAKNFAVLYRDGKPELAPAYDLLSTMVYENMSKKMAMNIGGENRMGMIKMEHFEKMAESCDIKPRLVRSEAKKLSAEILPQAEVLAKELDTAYPDLVYERIIWQIRKNRNLLS
ncbi:MAG: type II toxin-antitoxin system HipA family toxin [Victivallales bacterium]